MKLVRYSLLFLVILLGIVFAGSVYILDYSLGRRDGEWSEAQAWDRLYMRYPWASQWMDSVRADGVLQDTFILSDDGRRLHAYYLAHHSRRDSVSKPRGTAVLLHGYRNCAIDMMHLGYMYHHCLGYNIFLPDHHAHGQSEGESIRMGWLDRLDVIRWCGIADSLFSENIVVHGISMGAAATMMLSAEENIPPSVTHFIEDCGYTSVWEEFHGQLWAEFSLPAFPLLYSSSALCSILYGWDFSEADALAQVKNCRRPMLFIHGDSDDFVPTSMVHPLYEAHPETKELWLTEGVGHALSYSTYPEEYTRRVREFLSR